MKFCKYCIHFELNTMRPSHFSRCYRYGELDPVMGTMKPAYADLARVSGGPCGPEANGFESQETHDNG